jgi:hypothetical protein
MSVVLNKFLPTGLRQPTKTISFFANNVTVSLDSQDPKPDNPILPYANS